MTDDADSLRPAGEPAPSSASAGSADAGSAAPAPSSPGDRARALARPVPMLVLALVASLLWATWLLVRSDSESGDRRDVLSVAETYAINLTTFDYANLDRDFEQVLANSTGTFRSEYAVAKESLQKLIKQYKGRATTNVIAAAVADLDSDRARVLLFVDQSVSNRNTEQVQVNRYRMDMTLDREGGRWLISDLQLQ